ncbi:MAG: hypothetical protein ACE1Y1_00135 [Nitrosomonadaceae bacterium]
MTSASVFSTQIKGDDHDSDDQRRGRFVADPDYYGNGMVKRRDH